MHGDRASNEYIRRLEIYCMSLFSIWLHNALPHHAENVYSLEYLPADYTQVQVLCFYSTKIRSEIMLFTVFEHI